ncbi:hypothetical protein HDZ31DRAFT_49006 [Schizophyllum fasciatum]
MSNRPRPSILEMFDPLARPSTPPRDGSASDSDKENSLPPNAELGLSAIFGRTYKLPHDSPTQPRQLKTRLVDVGDVTLDLSKVHVQDYDSDEEDHHLLTMTMPEEDEEEALESDNENPEPPAAVPTRHSSPSTPRTPLGELQVDQETPVLRSKVFKRRVLDFSPRTPQAFAKSPLSSVIDDVNTSGRMFGSQNQNSPALGSPLPSPKLAPEIRVSTAESDSDNGVEADVEENENDVPEVQHAPPQPSLRPSPTLRPSARNSFASNTSNRMSLDLQSSFQLHFESSDASFDLMNDKISFLHSTSKGESFLADLDESMEDDENVVPPTIPSPANCSSKLTPLTSPSVKESFNEAPATPTSPTPFVAPSVEQEQPPRAMLDNNAQVVAHVSAIVETSPPSAVSPANPPPVFHPPVHAPVFTAPAPAPAARPVVKPVVATPQIPGGRRTSMAPPALVPALRIVKRARKESRSSALSSMSSMKEESVVSKETAPIKEAAAPASKPPRRSSVSTTQGPGTSGPRRLLGSDAAAPAVPTLKLGGSGPKRIKMPASTTPAEAPVRPASRADAPGPIRAAPRTDAPVHGRSVARVSSAPAPAPAKEPAARPAASRAASSRLPAPSSRIPSVGRSSGLPMPASKRAVPTIRRT